MVQREAGVRWSPNSSWNLRWLKYASLNVTESTLSTYNKLANTLTKHDFMRDAAANDAVVLFVGTKEQAADAVEKQNVQVNTSSTTFVGWVVPLLTREQSKTSLV